MAMTMTTRDRRALAILSVAVVGVLAYLYWPDSAPTPVAVTAGESVAQSEQRLARMRDLAATVPAKEAILKQVHEDLAAREKGILQADTAQQAQAQLIQMVRRLGLAENPPVTLRSTEIGPVLPLGDSYGAANVSMQFECGIEQLVNLLSALGSQPELVAPSDLIITSSSPKEKTIGVRLTITGVVPAKLLPVRGRRGGLASQL
jgi:hypothetical protein